jgi:hypothetical protein
MFSMVFKCFLGIFSSVSYACFKCFICLHLYVATVASGCFKSRSGVAYIAMAIQTCFKCFICFTRMLQVFHLDVLKVDLGEAHAAVASAAPWVTVHAC